MRSLSVAATVVVLAWATGSLAQVAEQDLQRARDEHIAKHFPYVEQGAAPPERGLRTWRTRHGPAVVWFQGGRPFRAEGARLPDGSRGDVAHMLDHGWRRRAGDGRRWVHGSIEIRPDDVVFIDGVQPIYMPPPQTDVPNLEADLARDAAFLAAIQDDRFANAAYSAFRNGRFLRGSDERVWSIGISAAGALVRDLRGLGESYQDWFPYGGLDGVYPPDDRPARAALLNKQIAELSRSRTLDDLLLEVPATEPDRTRYLNWFENRRSEYERHLPEMDEHRLKSLELAKQALAKLDSNTDVFEALHGHLTRLGWRPEAEQDRALAHQRWLTRAIVVLQDIKELEKRPQGSPEDWAEAMRRRQGSSGIRLIQKGALDRWSPDEREAHTGGVERRLQNLATTGRVTKDEYDQLAKRLQRN
jgi:hypothetical protein